MTPKQEQKMHLVLSDAHHDFVKGLTKHATFKVQDRDTCDDLVQDAFMKTWLYLLKGGKIHLMKAFLYHILNNLIVDEYRKRKSSSLDTLIEKGFDPSEDDSERLMDALDGKHALILIQRLPKKYQLIMRMRYVQLLSLKEMSLITGESKSTLAVQAHRGLEKLKTMYEHRDGQ